MNKLYIQACLDCGVSINWKVADRFANKSKEEYNIIDLAEGIQKYEKETAIHENNKKD